VLAAIRALAAANRYGNAFHRTIERALGRRVPTTELIGLARAGFVALDRPTADLVARPLDPPRSAIEVARDEVCARLGEVIAALGGASAPYHRVREWFDWLTPTGRDQLRPVIDALARDGLIVLGRRGGRLTLDLPSRPRGIYSP